MAEADHCALVGWLGCALFVCLFVWSVCWLLVWLIGWLVCALFVCLVGWLFILLFVSLVDWLVGWLVGRLVGWLGCALVRIRSLSAGASVTLPSAQQRIIPMREEMDIDLYSKEVYTASGKTLTRPRGLSGSQSSCARFQHQERWGWEWE